MKSDCCATPAPKSMAPKMQRRRYRIISTPFSKLTHINRNFDEVPHFWIGQPDWVETVALTCEELIRCDDILAELKEGRYDFGLAAAYGG
ncbi:hypothetical protein AAVH_27118 [Aphelenchoides avenae]|nr:hypothetical protein AAVH_27118 [Aphelenchus avenae]